MIKTIIVSLLISVQAFGATCNIPTQINEGDKSPCSGYVISKETEERIRVDLAYKDKIIENLTKASDLQADLISIHAQQINNYQAELGRRDQLSSWEKIMYFGLGAIVTGAVAYGTVQALRH